MKRTLIALVAIFIYGGATQVIAAPLFSDDFEAGLGQWGTNAFGQIVSDPTGGSNQVLKFSGVNAGGDIFTSSAIATTTGQKYTVSFDFYGATGNDSSSGGFAGLANGTGIPDAGAHVWYAGTTASALSSLTPAAIVLIDDNAWHHIAYTFTAPLVSNMIRLMFEDFSGSGPTAANAYFDNVQLSAVPVPAALPLFGTGLGIMGFLGWRRRRQAQAA